MDSTVVPFRQPNAAVRMVEGLFGAEAAAMLRECLPLAKGMTLPWRTCFQREATCRWVVMLVRDDLFPSPWPQGHPDHYRHHAYDVALNVKAVILDVHDLPDITMLPMQLALLISNYQDAYFGNREGGGYAA